MTVPIRALCAALLAAAPLCANAAPKRFDFADPKQMNAAALSINAAWEPVVGFADGITGSATFDPTHPERTVGNIVVDVSSVRFSNAGYTQTARFYALEEKKYPQITCRLKKIKTIKTVRPGVFTGTVLVDFTCHGVTKELTVPLDVSHLPGVAKNRYPDFPGDLLVVRCNFDILRADFNIAKSVSVNEIGDRVSVRLAIVGTQKPVPVSLPKPVVPEAKPAVAPADIPIALLGTTYSLAERRAFHHVPGVSVAVIKDFKTAWVGHYGESSAGKPVTDVTRYMAGSMGEPLVAAAVLKASERGEIALDTPIDSLLTSWKVPASPLLDPARPITVRDLLTHQSGFTYNKYDGYAPGAPTPSLTAVLKGESPANTPATTVRFAPGSRYDMAAENYSVIEQVAVDVSRQPFDAVMRDRLFAPLGMKNSTFAPVPQTDVAAGHSETGAPVAGTAWIYPESAASGLWTTPRDFANAVAELLRCGANRGGTYLKPETAALLWKPLPLSGTESPQAIGFGISKRESITYLYRGGNTNGFYCHMDADAEAGNAVIVFTNGNLCWRFANEVRDAVAHAEGFRGF